MSKFKPFFMTRARLAEQLAANGIEVSPCQNIYRPDEMAWKCKLTKQAASIIHDDYVERGKPVPEVVLEALKQ